MKNQYLLEVIQRQTLFVSTEANSKEQAIDQVRRQQGKLEQPLPPQIEHVNLVGDRKPHN